MSKQKNQHFVPQIYLKNFSSDGKSINLYIKDSQLYRSCAPIKNQSSRNYFYGKDLEIENFLGEIEGELGAVLRKISNCSCDILTKDDCEFLFGYTFLQWGRTEASAIELVSTSKEMNNFVSSTFNGIDTSRYRAVEDLLENVKQSIRLGYEMLQTCSDLDYKFLINETAVDFITSDSPVSLYNQFHERIGKRSFAFGSIGAQVFFPLSPRIMFLIYDNLTYKIGTRKSKSFHICNAKDISQLNNITFINANKIIYFLNRSCITSFRSVLSVERESSKYTKFQYPTSGLFFSSNQPPLCNVKCSFIRETDKTKHIKSYTPCVGSLLIEGFLRRNHLF